MTLAKEKKTILIKDFEEKEGDTGSPSVQIALLTERINELTDHFKTHPKDHGSRRGLLKIVGHRRRLLNYLKKHDLNKYKDLISKLKIRK
ncbi:30S ribosomal protein S15 [bacterium]